MDNINNMFYGSSDNRNYGSRERSRSRSRERRRHRKRRHRSGSRSDSGSRPASSGTLHVNPAFTESPLAAATVSELRNKLLHALTRGTLLEDQLGSVCVERTRLEAENRTLKLELKRLNQQVARIPHLEHRNEGIVAEHARFRAEAQRLREDVARLNSDLRAERDRSVLLQSRNDTLSKKCSDYMGNITELQKRIDLAGIEKQNQLKEFQALIIEKAESECQKRLAQEEVSVFREREQEWTKERQDLEEQIRINKRTHKAQCVKYEEMRRKLAMKTEEFQKARQSTPYSSEQLEEIRQSVQRIRNECNVRVNLLKRYYKVLLAKYCARNEGDGESVDLKMDISGSDGFMDRDSVMSSSKVENESLQQETEPLDQTADAVVKTTCSQDQEISESSSTPHNHSDLSIESGDPLKQLDCPGPINFELDSQGLFSPSDIIDGNQFSEDVSDIEFDEEYLLGPAE